MNGNGRMTKVSIDLLLALLLVSSLISSALAADARPSAADFIGSWSGVITTPQDKNPVDLVVAATEKNRSSISFALSYGAPRSCTLNGVITELENNSLDFVIDEASGGFCDEFWKGSLSLKLRDDKRVDLKLQKPAKGPKEEALLTKQE